MFRSELYGLTNELVFGLSNIYISIFMLLILHQTMLTTTSANKILFRSFGESTDRRSGRRGGLMVNTLGSGSSDPGSSPARVHCFVFLGKTRDSHSASLHPGVQMGTGKFNACGSPTMD